MEETSELESSDLVEYRRRHLVSEVKPIVAILEDEEAEEWSVEEVADRIIDALDAVREKKSLYCVIARVSFDCGETWQFFVTGPYKTPGAARTKGESLLAASGGDVKWLSLQMVRDPRTFLKDERDIRRPKDGDLGGSAWSGEVPESAVRVTAWIEPIQEEVDHEQPDP